MEYKEEENSVPGNIPEFGAVFMSNAETKRECFKRRVFALPSSMAGFVKHVKEGMVLFLFEFEKRQLFGVYRATSDGALNILPNAFRSAGKQFPAQVCFTPIWLCSPLSENEFRSAIYENYYSAKKFKFGLSKDQVHRLLQLFSLRKLKDRLPVPPRQLSRGFSRSSSKIRKQINHGRFAIREGLEMERSREEFTPTVMNEYLENIEDRDAEVDDGKFYIEDRAEDRKSLKSFGQGYLSRHSGNNLHKERRISYGGLETDEARASPLSFRTDNEEVHINKKRISTASGRYLGDEDRDDEWNIFNPPAFASKYSAQPSNLTKAANGRPYSDCTKRPAPVDGRFLINDIKTSELDLHNARRPVISERESYVFKRSGKIADDFEYLRNGAVGHHYHIDDDIAAVFPSETSLHRMRGTARHRRLLPNEKVISEHDPDSGQGISSSSWRVADPFNSHEREFDEKLFPRNNLVKTNYMEGYDGSATLNVSSGHDTRIERSIANDFGLSKTSSVVNGHVGTLPRPVMSVKSSGFHQPCQSSLECFTEPFPDSQFPGFTTESQNLNAPVSIFHDSVVTRSCLSEVSSACHAHSKPFRAHQGTRVAKESIPHHSEGNFFGVSEGKSFEAEGSNTYNASSFSNKVSFPNYHDYSSCPADEISDGMDLKPFSSADYKTYQFSPSSLGPIPFSESEYFGIRDNPLPFDGHPCVASEGMQTHITRQINNVGNYIPWQANDEVYAGNEQMSPYSNLSDLDMCCPERDPMNQHFKFIRGYRADVIDDKSQYYRSPKGPCADHEKRRRSVFARLASTPKLHAEDQEDDSYFYDASSVDDVDEIMEMLHQNRNAWAKNLRKFNSVRQHDDKEEMEKNSQKISIENQVEHSHSNTTPVKNKETNPATGHGVDDKPKETRIVEFKRRREMKKSLDDKPSESNAVGIEDSKCAEIEELKGPLDNQVKRRKLVRPVFGQKNC